jgi:polysaccharide export outer membrane protein
MRAGVRGVVLLFSALVTLPDLFAPVVAAEQSTQTQPVASKPVSLPAEYVIGIDDVLTITIVGENAKYSGDVSVRPDAKITLLLVGDALAAGLTPVQLRAELTKAYADYFKDPVILISPKQINSRRVSIAGLVHKPGEYRLSDPMDLVQLIVRAGGLRAGADRENIELIRRQPNGTIETIPFNLAKLFEDRDVTKIPKLRPGDQVVVK